MMTDTTRREEMVERVREAVLKKATERYVEDSYIRDIQQATTIEEMLDALARGAWHEGGRNYAESCYE